MLSSRTEATKPSNQLSSDQFTRIGAVSYLNSKPLIEGLASRLQHPHEPWESFSKEHVSHDKSKLVDKASSPNSIGRLSTDLPSRLADQLHRQELDIGLIPVFESFRNESFLPVSNAGIVSRGPVWSVRLLFRTAPQHVRSVALDEGSRTSAALSKVLLHDELGFVPETKPFPIGASAEEVDGDAVLIIGDRAMHPELYLKSFRDHWDLGEVWWQRTGLPFVFARWIARDRIFATPEMASILNEIRDYGVAHVGQISERIHAQYDLSLERCEEYLTDFIHFEIDELAQRGLDEFRRRCQDLELIP